MCGLSVVEPTFNAVWFYVFYIFDNISRSGRNAVLPCFAPFVNSTSREWKRTECSLERSDSLLGWTPGSVRLSSRLGEEGWYASWREGNSCVCFGMWLPRGDPMTERSEWVEKKNKMVSLRKKGEEGVKVGPGFLSLLYFSLNWQLLIYLLVWYTAAESACWWYYSHHRCCTQ